jgi:ATP-binding cassette subfamily B protein
MDTLMRGRTVFIVAHRLTTIRKADRIVVMEKGRMVECGSHDELLKIGGAYSALQHPRVQRDVAFDSNDAIAV